MIVTESTPSRSSEPRLGPAVLVFALTTLFSLPYAVQLVEVPASDIRDYEVITLNLLEGHGYVLNDVFRAYRMPGLVFFLLPIYAIWGPANYLAVRVIQSAMLGAMNLLIYHMGCRLGGRRLGFAVGLLCAACHEFVFWAAKPATEFLYTFLMVSATAAMIEAVLRRRTSWAIATGCLLGAAYMTRPIPLFVVLFWAIGLWRLRPRNSPADPARANQNEALPVTTSAMATRVELLAQIGPVPSRRLALAFGAAVFLVCLPWFLRNYALFGRVFVNSNSGITIWWANHPSAEVGGWYGSMAPALSPRVGGPNELQVNDRLTANAIEFIRRDPARFVRLALGRIVYLLFGSKEMLTHVPPDRLVCFPGVELELIKWNWPFLLLAVLGFSIAWRRGESSWWILTSVIVGTLLVHLVYTSVPRMRVPLLPMLYLGSVRGLWGVFDLYRLKS